MARKQESELEKVLRIGDGVPRSEWDFLACPEENLYFCFGYEFARQLAREVPAFLARFKAAPAKEFDANGTWHYILTGQLDEATGGFDFAEFVDAPPGFPPPPFFSLEQQNIPHPSPP